uniref:Uncharacterized protein n=1 Tax=Cercocebus atys TaxID=9531 RepID=A0A2K5M252_CERAT
MKPVLPSSLGFTSLRNEKTRFSTAAEPFSPPRGDSAQSTVCDRHMAVQRRLDVMEEKPVDHLTGVKACGLVEGAWNLPPAPDPPR